MLSKENKEIVIPSSSPPGTPVCENNQFYINSSPIEESPVHNAGSENDQNNIDFGVRKDFRERLNPLALESVTSGDIDGPKTINRNLQEKNAKQIESKQGFEKDSDWKTVSGSDDTVNTEMINSKIEMVKRRFPELDENDIVDKLKKFNWKENMVLHKLTFQRLLKEPSGHVSNKTSQEQKDDKSVKPLFSKTNIPRKRDIKSRKPLESAKSRKKTSRVIQLSDEEKEEEEEEEGISTSSVTGKANTEDEREVTSEEKPDEHQVQNESDEETDYDKRVLDFLNSCTSQELLDVSGCPHDIVEYFISKRPYPSLSKAEVVHRKKITEKQKRSKSDAHRVGKKVVNATYEVLQGFDAVDSLINRCEKYGRLIANTLKGWHYLQQSKNNDNPKSESGEECIPMEYMEEQPGLLAPGMKLKSYQMMGVNWLRLMYHADLSGILADEMGLGKTCQVIAFLASMKEKNIKGPHLVVVPASTLENWIREFTKFCPSIRVEEYSGNQTERVEKRYYLMDNEYDVLVTNYHMASGSRDDRAFLRRQKFNICVFDEGHYLKNRMSERYKHLMNIPAKFRLLITGTPLQNNLKELISLLAFMLPRMFDSNMQGLDIIYKIKPSSDGNFERAYLSQQRISRAKSIMNPFILRRKKADVLSDLPKKIQHVEYCSMEPSQKGLYEKLIQLRNDPSSSRENIIMQLRKVVNHQLLFRSIYSPETLKTMSKRILREDQYLDANESYIYEDMEVMSDFELHHLCMQFKSLHQFQLQGDPWMKSGKVNKLVSLLHEVNTEDRTLIFSQFTQVLDILELVLTTIGIKFLRLDGSTPVDTRQSLLDEFHENPEYKVFLLSTKSGGFGINLTCANVVVMYDCSFNPFDDLQAEDRAHRVGQTRPVHVYRLITENSIEENIRKLAATKLTLESSLTTESERIQKEITEDLIHSLS
ncbi:SNF2 family domain-containing protein [Schizosaccharomyces cryophilus OY26]|uniref:DNA helicase n=1 Tax=Schizosaccharomyces cryophilus (strain OY26 / ATCC MYA-4695 / CBS 11777 / NBRC 106824 / NRRL Y48691) TaxID=653667 RepID=S9VXL5_SCHCR|nr:SNF2 family domain-containing protein [Schizosaccharomyces cryophilus OY26]EPY50944.1 SNF2 family domain-containing protein [Schizosaccharomyces cryophilus OY26]